MVVLNCCKKKISKVDLAYYIMRGGTTCPDCKQKLPDLYKRLHILHPCNYHQYHQYKGKTEIYNNCDCCKFNNSRDCKDCKDCDYFIGVILEGTPGYYRRYNNCFRHCFHKGREGDSHDEICWNCHKPTHYCRCIG